MKKLVRITTVPISLLTLLKGQLKFMSNYYQVIAVSGEGLELDQVEENECVRIKGITMERDIALLKDLMSLIKLIIFLKKEKPLIVHTHTPKAGLLGMIASYIVRVPVRIHTVAGLPLMEKKGIKKRVLIFTERLTYTCAHKVYPNSNGLKEYILNHFFPDSSKFRVIANGSSNGIDLDYFNPQIISEEIENTIRSKYQLSISDFLFVFIGRVVKDKGIEELVNAFIRINRKFNFTKLLIVGNYENNLDPIESSTKVLIDSSNCIINVGFQKDVRPFLKVSSVLVHPSYREGFPNVVMQAGAMGLPVIATNINGCNEIIVNNQNGLLVEPKNVNDLYNKMELIVGNCKILKKLRSNSRLFIENRFDQKIVWKGLLSEYQSFENYV